jgi:hypothetical protein
MQPYRLITNHNECISRHIITLDAVGVLVILLHAAKDLLHKLDGGAGGRVDGGGGYGGGGRRVDGGGGYGYGGGGGWGSEYSDAGDNGGVVDCGGGYGGGGGWYGEYGGAGWYGGVVDCGRGYGGGGGWYGEYGGAGWYGGVVGGGGWYGSGVVGGGGGGGGPCCSLEGWIRKTTGGGWYGSGVGCDLLFSWFLFMVQRQVAGSETKLV